jgi:hypothetical protein
MGTPTQPVTEQIFNGMSASALSDVEWQKPCQGNDHCVEIAALPDGRAAVRNSTDPGGPALIYTRAEIEALILGAKAGALDYLI